MCLCVKERKRNHVISFIVRKVVEMFPVFKTRIKLDLCFIIWEMYFPADVLGLFSLSEDYEISSFIVLVLLIFLHFFYDYLPVITCIKEPQHIYTPASDSDANLR